MALMRRTLPAVLISCRCSEVSGPFPTRATVAEALTMLHSWSGEPQRKGALGTSACLSHSGAGHHLLQHGNCEENYAMAGACMGDFAAGHAAAAPSDAVCIRHLATCTSLFPRGQP